MHSPEVVAFEIRRPWPRRPSKARHGGWRWSPPFVNIAGREFYFPSLVTVWHVEPHGEDALRGECKDAKHWQWHVHHWDIQWCFLQTWQRRLLSRCAWCGGRHTKRDPLNTGIGGWHSERTPLWRGERDIVHGDCYSVLSAHRLCLCDDPGLSQGDHGSCAFCGKLRGWRHSPTIPERYLASLPAGSRIPDDKREWLNAEWAKLRAEREAAERESDEH